MIKNTMLYLEAGKCPKCGKHGLLFCRIERRDKGNCGRSAQWVICFIVKHVIYSHTMYLKEKATGVRNSRMKITKYCYLRGRTQHRLHSMESD